jgi:hypothetical protein
VDNIENELREIEWGGMDRIDLDQDRDQWKALVNTVMDFLSIYLSMAVQPLWTLVAFSVS